MKLPKIRKPIIVEIENATLQTVPDYIRGIKETDIEKWNKMAEEKPTPTTCEGYNYLVGTKENPIDTSTLTQTGVYIIKDAWVAMEGYRIETEDIILYVKDNENGILQYYVGTDAETRFYWYSRFYRYTEKIWREFRQRYIDRSGDDMNNDDNVYSGKSIRKYYGNTKELDTVDKSTLVAAVNELTARIKKLEDKKETE